MQYAYNSSLLHFHSFYKFNLNMKKILIIFSLFVFITNTQAQTGINTLKPNTSFEVAKQSEDNQVVGVLFPRSSGDDLATLVDSSFDGTIVYVTSAASNPSGATTDVLNKGYYHFNAQTKRWSLLGRKYDNIIEENNLIYAQVKREGTLRLHYPGNTSNSNDVQNNYVPWNSIEGTPAAIETINNESGQEVSIPLGINGSVIFLPKGHVFRITAMVSIVSASKPGYVVAKFEANPSNSLLASTLGYIETANELYQEGGVAYPVAVVDTSKNSVLLQLNAAVHGHSTRDRGLVLGGGENDDPYYTTYLVIEEI